MDKPLLSGSEKTNESERLDSYQYLQRNSSSARNPSFAGAGVVTVEEIRTASAVSSDPPSLYPPVIKTPVSLPIRKSRSIFPDPSKFCIDTFSYLISFH
jgi:hypothetical protein